MKCAIKNSYKTHKYKHEPKHKLYISSQDYRLVLKKFFTKLAYYLITTGERINLPAKLGALQIVKYKSNRKNIDFYKTKKYYGEENKTLEKGKKKVIFASTKLTGGFRTRLFWYKTNVATFTNQRSWSVKLSRPNVRINKDNKTNPAVNLVDFFREKGWFLYKEMYFDNHKIKLR